MNIEELRAQASAWKDEKENERAIILIAVEQVENNEKHTCYNVSQQVEGTGQMCVSAFKAILSNHDDANVLPSIMKRSFLELSTEELLKNICHE